MFSLLVNMLMLTGPLYMLQLYDRVLASRSEPTLLTLSLLVAALFLAMGLLDHARGRVLARAGARFQALLDRQVFETVLRRATHPDERGSPSSGSRDLEAIQQAISGPAPFAFLDAPWAPEFLAVIFLFHWSLGLLAVVAGMPVEVYLQTGERSPLSYFTRPFTDYFNRSMREE